MQVATPKKGYKFVKTSFGKYEEIPEEWDTDSFENHYRFVKGRKSTQIFENKGIDRLPYLTNSSLSGRSKDYTQKSDGILVKESDIIMSVDGTVGKVYTSKKGILGSTFTLFNKKQNKIDNKFIFYYLRYKYPLLRDTSYGTGILHLDKFILKKLQIPILPQDEQKQIASILSNVDDTIQKTDQIIEQTQRLKKGMMQKLLTRGIGHTKFKTTKIGEIPETWDLVRVEDIIKTKGDVRTGPFGSHLLNHELVDRGIRVIYPEDIVNHTISDSVKKCITSEKYQKLKRYSVKSRDVVISLMGTIGQIGLVNEDVGKAIISKHILKISLDPKKFYPEFFCHLFDFTPINNQLHALSQGQIMKGLNTKIIKEIKLLAPKLNEQQQIASILSNIDTQIGKEKLYKSNLERLKKGLMQKLLTGQIRVKVK